MGLGKLIAWALLIAAFLSAAAEVAGQALTGTLGFMSAHELLYTFVPGKYIVFQSWIEDHVSRTLWNPILRTVLAVPAWMLFAVPGVALAWASRTRPLPAEEEHDKAYTTYEDIVEAAKEADEEVGEYLPSKYADHAEYDPTDAELEDDGEAGTIYIDDMSGEDETPAEQGPLVVPWPRRDKENGN